MRCHIVRPFDLITRFWTYKIRINNQDFLFKGIGTKSVNVEQVDSYRISVSTPGLCTPSSVIDSCNLSEDCRITIMSKFTNWSFIIVFATFLMLNLVGWLILDNKLYTCVVMMGLLATLFYFFNIKRKHFFKISVEK